VGSDLILFDYALLAIIAISTIISLFRGFFREALSLATWALGVWCAWRLGPQMAHLLEAWITPPLVRLWVARALVLIAVLIAGGLVGALLQLILHSTGLSGTDRAVGMVFGCARGALLVGILLVVMQAADFDQTEWWPRSVLIPYFDPVTDIIRHAAEDGLELLDELDAGDATAGPAGPVAFCNETIWG
jgi:membrane protein required for colicin V production